jgi:ABC-type dipeptide/oligopeptide/nickel transport system permease component
MELILDSFAVSFVLGISALFIALLIGVPSGVCSAMNKGKAADYFFFSFSVLGVSMPSIVLGPLLILIFGVWLELLPVAGWGSITHLILPSFTLGVIYASFVARLTREGLIEALQGEYVKSARAMGIKESKIVYKYAMRNSILPLLSYLGPAFAGIISGSLVIENIFQINGLGTHFVNSALNRDYPLALGTVIFYSCVLVLINLVTDVLYFLVDPRIKGAKDV